MSLRAESIPPDAWQSIGEVLIQSIMLNFQVGGRPEQWPQSKRAQFKNSVDGEGSHKTLVDTGALMNSGRADVGTNFVDVTWGQGLPYAVAQNFGADINQTVTERQRAFFWAKWYESDGTIPAFKAMALAKTLHIVLPQRKFMRIQDEDVQTILNILRNYIINNQNFPITIS